MTNPTTAFWKLTLPWICLALIGCRSSGNQNQALGLPKVHHFTLIPITSDPSTQPAIEGRKDPIYMYVDLYTLRVPLGAISANPAIWEKVDRETLGAAQGRLLRRNGIQIGTATVDQWDSFKALIDQYPTVTQASKLTGGEGQGVELRLKEAVPFQTLFYYDPQGRLHGRTYDQADDLLAIHFQPSKKFYAYVRISLSPIIRSTRKRLAYTALNRPQTFEYVEPEHIYQLGLKAEVPPGRFLIIAPSDQAVHPTRLGHLFLIQDTPAERFEKVLILVPHVFRAVEQKRSNH